MFLIWFTLGAGVKNLILVLVLLLMFLVESTDVSPSPCGLTFAVELFSLL